MPSRLQSLTVRNLALVDKALLEFSEGLNVVTGETGAGKSVLIGALRLLAGVRADKGMIRSGEKECAAEAVFELADPASVDAILADAGVDPCEEGQLIIRRVVKASGSGGQARVNNCTVTLAVLRRLGELLIDMHGPYDHQSLLRTESQMSLLDRYGKTGAALDTYHEAYQAWRAHIVRKEDLLQDEASISEQMGMLEFRVREIEDASIQAGEETELLQEHALQANAQSIAEEGNATLSALDDRVFPGLVDTQRALESLDGLLPGASEWRDEAQRLAVVIQEMATEIRAALSRVVADPARLEFLDERLTTYASLKRKYGPEVDEVLQTLATARERLHDLATREEQLAVIDQDIAKALKTVEATGKKLRTRRTKAATQLASGITTHLKDLGFAKGRFDIQLTPAASPRPGGLDDIEFAFAPNAGEDIRPLRAIASSGEISRVMLACKAVLAEHDEVALMVFDEIDANVGGEMGVRIGEKMAEVARHHQIITITHLPQVAACGQHHLAVEKQEDTGRAVTTVRPLGKAERIEEIARMLGGKSSSKVTTQHARELLAAGR